MSTYTTPADGFACHDKTLVASTPDRINFSRHFTRVEVISDGRADIYFTVDGSDALSSGPLTFKLPAGGGASRDVAVPTGGPTSVSLIAGSAVSYSVTAYSD